MPDKCKAAFDERYPRLQSVLLKLVVPKQTAEAIFRVGFMCGGIDAMQTLINRMNRVGATLSDQSPTQGGNSGACSFKAPR